MTKTTNLYQVREFIGTAYSKQLGRRLRARTDALRLVRMLKKQGRDVFATPVRISFFPRELERIGYRISIRRRHTRADLAARRAAMGF